jgi:hypothetical protein
MMTTRVLLFATLPFFILLISAYDNILVYGQDNNRTTTGTRIHNKTSLTIQYTGIDLAYATDNPDHSAATVICYISIVACHTYHSKLAY